MGGASRVEGEEIISSHNFPSFSFKGELLRLSLNFSQIYLKMTFFIISIGNTGNNNNNNK